MKRSGLSYALAASTALTAMAGFSMPTLAQQEAQLAIEEIIVTSRKREESLQDIPVAVSAFTNDFLVEQGITDLFEVARLTPGFSFEKSGGRGFDRPVIRGQANILGESGVSYFIDGVYITGDLTAYDLTDIERLEVVKGPQSALYGRNTYSGALNLVTRRPTNEFEGNASVRVGEHALVETTASVRGPIIEDKLFAGISLRYYDFGGEFTNQFDGEKVGQEETYSGSVSLTYLPNESWEFDFRALYQRDKDNQPAITLQSHSENNCYIDNGALYQGVGRYFCGVVKPEPVNVDYRFSLGGATNDPLFLDRETYNTSLKIEYTDEEWTFTSITGYNRVETKTQQDADYLPTSFQTTNFAGGPFIAGPPNAMFQFPFGSILNGYTDFANENSEDRWDISEEIRLRYEADGWEALLGGYYFRDRDPSQQQRTITDEMRTTAAGNLAAARAAEEASCTFNPICSGVTFFSLFGPPPSIREGRNLTDRTTRNLAVFGYVSYDITEDLNFQFEGRYAEEKVSVQAITQSRQNGQNVVDGTVIGFTPDNLPAGTVLPASFDPNNPEAFFPADAVSEVTFTSFKPRMTINYNFNDDQILYLTAAKGTKPGGFNGATAIAAGVPSFEEEKVWAVEIGNKNTFAEGTIRLNWAAFYNQVSGYQLTQNVQAIGQTNSATVNAGDADIYGLEMDGTWLATENLTFNISYAFTDSEFKRGLDQNQGVLNDTLDDGLVNCSIGDQFPEVAGCTSRFGSIVGKRIPRQSKHQATFNANWTAPLNDTWDYSINTTASYESGRFAQVHNEASTGDSFVVDLQASIIRDQFTFQVWGKNIFDEDAVSGVIRYVDASFPGFNRAFIMNLRPGSQWGATARYSF